MANPNAAANSRRYRERRAQRLAPLQQCSTCPRRHHGAHGDLCNRCWQALTPEGRADRAARVALSRARHAVGVIFLVPRKNDNS
jgi:hypothetical protein